MNKIINKCLLAGEKFMPKLHLRKSELIYSASRPFTKHRDMVKRLSKTGDLNYIYKNELDKACFAHDATYADSQYLAKRTVSDKISKIRLIKLH